jgi:3-dehydroquinate synthase
MLRGAEPHERLEELLARREVWYREVADLVVETGRPSVSRLAALIIESLRAHPEGAALVASVRDVVRSGT